MSRKHWFWFAFFLVLSLVFAADVVVTAVGQIMQYALLSLLCALLATVISVTGDASRNYIVLGCVIGADFMAAMAAYVRYEPIFWLCLAGVATFSVTTVCHVHYAHSQLTRKREVRS